MSVKKKIIILILAVCILAALIWVILSISGKAAAYEEALRLMETGDTEAAYLAFLEMGTYRESDEIREELLRADPVLPYRTASKGDILAFGSFEQDNDLSDGTEAIEWIVIDRIDDEILLLSLYCLDCRTYNDKAFEAVTWEESGLRKWLNGDFYESAFSDEEKSMIMLMENQNPDQSLLGTEGGRDTSDRVYLLGEKEAGIYIGNEMDQDYIGRAQPTEYALSRGAHTDESGMTEWWLRTPGSYEYTAQFVETSGIPYAAGAYVDISYAVRPVIWLNNGIQE